MTSNASGAMDIDPVRQPDPTPKKQTKQTNPSTMASTSGVLKKQPRAKSGLVAAVQDSAEDDEKHLAKKARKERLRSELSNELADLREEERIYKDRLGRKEDEVMGPRKRAARQNLRGKVDDLAAKMGGLGMEKHEKQE